MTYKFCIFVWILINCTTSLALWESSIPLVDSKQKILVQNTSSESQSLWLVLPSTESESAYEISFEIPARQKLTIPLNFAAPWIKIWGQNKNMHVYHSRKNSRWQALFKETSNQYRIVHSSNTAELWLSNLSAHSQKIEVKDFATNETYISEIIDGFESKKATLPNNFGMLKISGEYRIAVLYNNEIALPLKSEFKKTKSNLFLLANSANNQSFVAEIEDPLLAQQAREQIKNPLAFLPRMLIARVSPGHNSTNTDHLSKLQAPWSWHVSRIHRFADFGSTECNSAPLILEHYLKSWMEYKNGLICFWDYKIVKEL